jgi:uncharacterized protein DUF4397
MRAPLLRIVIAAGIVAAAGLPAATASAAPVEQQAMIRGAHLSPDTTNVDVYLTAFAGGTTTLWLSSVGYGDVSSYEWLKPGSYAVSMRPHGAAASTPAALSWTFTAKAGHAYTAAGVGLNKDLQGIIIEDQINPPAAGHGLVRVIQAASRAPHADVTAQNGAVLAKSVAFTDTTQYMNLPAGTVKVTAQADGAALNTSAMVTIKSSSVSSVVLLDGQQGGLDLRMIPDAAGAATRPLGSVPAGAGGTAPRPGHDDLTWAWAVGAGALVAGGLVTLRRRRAVAA